MTKSMPFCSKDAKSVTFALRNSRRLVLPRPCIHVGKKLPAECKDAGKINTRMWGRKKCDFCHTELAAYRAHDEYITGHSEEGLKALPNYLHSTSNTLPKLLPNYLLSTSDGEGGWGPKQQSKETLLGT